MFKRLFNQYDPNNDSGKVTEHDFELAVQIERLNKIIKVQEEEIKTLRERIVELEIGTRKG